MPAERTVDQRLSALERRLDTDRDQARVDGSRSAEPPRERDARRTDPTAAGAATSPGDPIRSSDRSPGGVSATDSEAGTEDPPSTGEARDPASAAKRLDERQSRDGGSVAANEATTDIESRLDAVEAELAELQAGLQALRGYVGNVDHVNETVERRANAALAAVERLEAAPTTPPSLASVSEPAAGEDKGASEGNEPGDRTDEQSVPRAVDEGVADESVNDDSGEAAQAATDRGLLDRLASLG